MSRHPVRPSWSRPPVFPVGVVSVLALVGHPSGPVAPGETFPFVIEGLDATPSTTDLSWLGDRPAGKHGGARVEGGHIVDGRGRPLRLLGVNFSFGANFPERGDADRVAAHLAKLGVNAVRHHHMDARDIWRSTPGGGREVDPDKLDRLAYLISRLAAHGVWSNLNLHVSRSVTAAEGFPDAESLPRYNKYVLYIDERLQALLKEYARALLGYRSPHTGRRLADEPSLVTVEITNENRFALSGLQPLRSLPPRYREELTRRWNTWLRTRYATTAALREAWGRGSEPLGEDIADFGDPSREESPWHLSVRGENEARLRAGAEGPDGTPGALHVEIGRASGVVHELELARGGLTLEEGRLYTVSFHVRASSPRRVWFDVSHDGSPWRPVGVGETLEVTDRWLRVVRPFRATESLPRGARCIFKLGDGAADVWIARPRIRRGGDLARLGPGASLEEGTIPLPESSLQAVVASDLRAFLEATETAFLAEMRRFLRKELGVKAPITGSQARWQSLAAFAPLDLVDAHAYWEHPRFPRRSWDQRDWNIPNTPMVRVPGNDALTRLAWYRVWERPFTVSEYNHPAPNDYQVECLPLFGAIAALQGWDGIYVYSYQHGAGSWDAGRIQRFFDINGNPAKLALLPAAALLFRRGDVLPARGRRTLSEAGGAATRALAIRHRVGALLSEEAAANRVPASAPGDHESDSGEVRWLASDPARARLLVDSRRTQLAAGFIGGDEVRLSAMRLRARSASREFGVVAASSLDTEPLSRSRRILVTTIARAENEGMEWNADRTSVGDRWGAAPSVVEIVPGELRLSREDGATKDSFRAFALDARGVRREEVEILAGGEGIGIRLDPSDRAVWYEVVHR